MKPEDAFNALQRQELLHKFVEIGKVLLTWAILKNVDMVCFKINPRLLQQIEPVCIHKKSEWFLCFGTSLFI